MNKFGRGILIILLFCATLLVGAFLTLRSEYAQKYLITFTEKLLTKSLGYGIKLEGLKISFPLKIQVNSLIVIGDQGEWLKAKGVKTKLLPLSLLPGRQIIISNLSAVELNWLSQPSSSKTNNDSQSNSETNLVLQRINFPHIVINEEIISTGKELELSLKGDLKYIAGKLQFNANSEILNNFNQFLTGVKVVISGYFNTEHKFLDIEKIDINVDLFNIRGFSSIDFVKESIKGKYDIFCSQLSRIMPELKGALKSEFNLSNSLQKPIIDGKIEIYDLGYINYRFPNFSLITKLEYDLSQQIGNFKVEESEAEFALNIYFKDQVNIIKFEQIKVAQGNNNIVGNLDYIKNYNVLNGSLDLKCTNFGTLANLFDLSASGEGNILLNLTSDKNIQRIGIEGDLSNISIEDFGASHLQVKANISDAWNLKLQEANIEIQDASYKSDTLLKTVNFKANSANNRTDFILQIDGKPYKTIELTTSGDIEINSKDKFDLNITKIDGIYNKSKVNAQQAITIKYKDQKLRYEVPGINFDKGKIIAHCWVDNRNINSKIIFKTLPLLLIDLHLPAEFTKAFLDSEVQIIGEVSHPEIYGKLNISNINFVPQETSNLILDAKYKDNNLHITSLIKNSSLMHGDFKLMLLVQLSLLPYKFEIERNKGIYGNLNLDLRIDALAALLLPPIHRFKGKLTADMKLSGNLNNPQVSGRSYIKEGKYENVPAGIKIKNINSIIEANRQKVELREFKAYDDDKKSISATGQWMLNQKNMPFNLTIVSNGLYFLNHPNVQGAAKADIKISGDINKAKIEGSIEPTLLEIQIPEQFKKEIIELNVTKVMVPEGGEEQLDNKGFLDWYDIGLDILISGKHKIFVRGWGVDAELGGKLKCKGSMKAPEIKGKLETIRGRYQEFGKQLTIKEGSLVFNGPIPPSPYLNIVGSATEDNIEIRLILAGPFLKPALSIESSPSLPQDEALSILLFGKQSAQISPFQGLQLADSLRRLSGGGGSMNMLGRARGLLKVDDIKIKNSSSDARDAALGVGKYLTDKVYLEIEKGTQAGSGKTRVEVEIRNNLSIESSVGESGSNAVGINWRHDY